MEDLQKAQRAYRELLSPARRLPNEIIAQIIQSCLKDPTILDTADRQMFAVLRSVCKRWRAISFSSHDLWRGLVITDENEVIGDKAESWFDRAGTCSPLKLRINYESLPLPNAIQTLLLDPERRWIHLSLNLSPVIYAFLHSMKWTTNPWKQVQHLELFHYSHHPPAGQSNFPAKFFTHLTSTGKNTLPCLKSLHLGRVQFKTPAVHDRPCHATLSILSLTMCTVSFDMMELLLDPHSLPCLQDLSLIHTSLVHRSEPMPMALHPGIRCISVTGVSTNAFLSMLTFPNLEVASISYDDFPSGHMPVAVSHFLEQSGSNIYACTFISG
ncbi:hypothetical protein BKA70DRAFT_1563359 [Coprinopsis sp. MPI-PUGE-AT-0042]|nr:hypothetical protein BKA70DRAFT_1563359 [Coprinopsis sp. MPI-PUGE-AT-0042]